MPWVGGRTTRCGLKGRGSFLAEPVLATLQAATMGTPCLPRASAFGLSPGLGSLDPLGRTEIDSIRTGTFIL